VTDIDESLMKLESQPSYRLGLVTSLPRQRKPSSRVGHPALCTVKHILNKRQQRFLDLCLLVDSERGLDEDVLKDVRYNRLC
jgi:hypothetical protein